MLGADAKKMTKAAFTHTPGQKSHMSNEPLPWSMMSTILERCTKCCGDPEDRETNTAWRGKENPNSRNDLLRGILEKDLETLLVYKAKTIQKVGLAQRKANGR